MAEGRQVRVGPARAVDELGRRRRPNRLEARVAHDLGLEAQCAGGDVDTDVGGSLRGTGESGNAPCEGPVDHDSTVPGYALFNGGYVDRHGPGRNRTPARDQAR